MPKKGRRFTRTLGAGVPLRTYRFFRRLSWSLFKGNMSSCLRYFFRLIMEGRVLIVDPRDELDKDVQAELDKLRK